MGRITEDIMDPLQAFLISGVDAIKRAKEKKREAEEAAKLRKSFGELSKDLNRKALINQGISMGLTVPQAEERTLIQEAENALTGYNPKDDPRFKVLTGSRMDPKEQIMMMKYLYQEPMAQIPKKMIYEVNRTGYGQGGGKGISQDEKAYKDHLAQANKLKENYLNTQKMGASPEELRAIGENALYHAAEADLYGKRVGRSDGKKWTTAVRIAVGQTNYPPQSDAQKQIEKSRDQKKKKDAEQKKKKLRENYKF